MKYIITLYLCLCFLPNMLLFPASCKPNNYCEIQGSWGLCKCENCEIYSTSLGCAEPDYEDSHQGGDGLAEWFTRTYRRWCIQKNFKDNTKCGSCGLCNGGQCIAHVDECETDSPICNKPYCTSLPGLYNCKYTLAPIHTPCETDYNECTINGCDGRGNCVHPIKSDGTPCSQLPSNECSTQTCENGICKNKLKPGACSDLRTHLCIVPYCQYDESLVPNFPHTYCATVDYRDYYDCCESDDECEDKLSHTKECFGLEIDPNTGLPTSDSPPGRCRYERIQGACSTEDAELGQLLGIPDADYTLYCKPDYPDCFGWDCIDPDTNETVTPDVQGECRHNKINRCCKEDIDCTPHETTSCAHWFCDSNDECNYEYKTACCKTDVDCTPPHPVLLDWECDLNADPVMKHHSKVEGEGVCHYEKLINVNECTPLNLSGTLVQNKDNFSRCTLSLEWIPAYDGVCTDIDHFDINLVLENEEYELIGNVEYEAPDREHPDYKHKDQVHSIIIKNVKCLNSQEEFRIIAKDSAGNTLTSKDIIIPKNTN